MCEPSAMIHHSLEGRQYPRRISQKVHSLSTLQQSPNSSELLLLSGDFFKNSIVKTRNIHMRLVTEPMWKDEVQNIVHHITVASQDHSVEIRKKKKTEKWQ